MTRSIALDSIITGGWNCAGLANHQHSCSCSGKVKHYNQLTLSLSRLSLPVKHLLRNSHILAKLCRPCQPPPQPQVQWQGQTLISTFSTLLLLLYSTVLDPVSIYSFRVSSFGSNKIIYSIKVNPVLQISCKETSMSSKQPHFLIHPT